MAAEHGRHVFVAGTFNGWSPAKHALKLEKSNGRYVGDFMIPTGRHEYKFIVDGQWKPDPLNPISVDDSHSGKNSVVVVK